ncbi:anthranilate phosphoribosyltransferase [Streptococcaceae bacterium ESL0687]|nr:anthranilate phosphoribosyltransferase [Streptococcaceae bacterium ESL0687]
MDKLRRIINFENLSVAEMMEVASNMFSGNYNEAQLSSLLTALKMKGESVDELTGLAKVMKARATQIPTSLTDAMDNCGTGGDYSDSFNISTTAAFVLAAGGINMAKHGNRSISSKSGSADVLEELGINLELSPERLAQVLEEIGIVFLFATNLHPQMKKIMPVRKNLALPTIMNLTGPLINPVNLDCQLLGTSRPDFIEETAKVLGNLGRRRALVISGAGGMDEANLSGVNNYALLDQGEVSLGSFSAQDLDVEEISLADIRGGDARDNAKILVDVLKGKQSPYLEITALNAGLGFFTNGRVASIKEGVNLAKDLIFQGRAMEKLELLKKYQS